MKLHSEKFDFTNGSSIEILQENWDISMRLSEGQRIAKENPIEDIRLQYFNERIYSVVIAPSEGTHPDLAGAYKMLETAPADLDRWYMAVQRINPGWFADVDHNPDEVVTFSDGSALTVTDGNRPTGIMKIRDLEAAAQRDDPGEEIHKLVFRTTIYPKLAACTIGDIPDEPTARSWPTAEINKWYSAVNRVNPNWFLSLHEIAKDAQAQAEELKKKLVKPAR